MSPSTAVAGLLLLAAVAAEAITGFRNDNPIGQISFAQQGQILSDVQQHHRFNFQPGELHNDFTRQLLPNANQPQNFNQQQQQQFFVPAPTVFQQQQQPPPAIIQPSQQVFFQPQPQQLVGNEQVFLPQAQPVVQAAFQPSTFFQHTQQQFNGHQIPLVPEAPKVLPTQSVFLPTIPTQQSNFEQTTKYANFQLQSSTDNKIDQAAALSNPLFSSNQRAQLQSLLDEQRQHDLERLRELQERQKIIQKHKQFLERQQQKQQQRVQKLHEEFTDKQKKKQEQIYATLQPSDAFVQNTKSHPRDLLPHEAGLFEKALKHYDELHPTTPLTTTTTTTTTTTPRPKPTRGRQKPKSRSEGDQPEVYLQANRQKIYKELKTVIQNDENSKKQTQQQQQQVSPSKLLQLQRQDLLKQLKLAIAENSNDFGDKNFTAREISLPNGEKFEVIRTSDPNLIPGATPISADSSSLSQIISSPNRIRAPSKVSFEDLSKGVLPPDTDFEVIKQDGNGKLEEVGKLPSNLSNQKKVTFVFLEEQGDGSFQVKGVRGNGNAGSKEPPGVEIDSILKKIKEGEIRLPPKKPSKASRRQPNRNEPKATTYSRPSPTASLVNSPTVFDRFEATKIGSTASSLLVNHNGSPTSPTVYYDSTTALPTTYSISSTTLGERSTTRVDDTISILPSSSSYYPTSRSTTPQPSSVPVPEAAATQLTYTSAPGPSLVEILKDNGLFATAKYLKQSGLDTILNETGPYTVFAPTDKAFRTLLIQLGGPDKAEEKFKENPRLLSGLLLHHVIPGSFEISSLQDEMTGVSLAGTQLRVNQYNMHDVEWNEIKVTTVNGARVISDKQDINIPQGVAHAVDRVMFPLPVGDIVQTLQADRERRFTNFLKALFASDVVDTLSDSRTYTVFAPTDRAFSHLKSDELQRLVSSKNSARELVMKHISPGTLFSAGMRYYQVKDSMENEKPITLQKNAGRIKVNSGYVVTHNIPATNGVIHAIDTLL